MTKWDHEITIDVKIILNYTPDDHTHTLDKRCKQHLSIFLILIIEFTILRYHNNSRLFVESTAINSILYDMIDST